jgi:hypothetical protein
MTGVDLYTEDILLWSERQAALLRRAAAGDRSNEPDWTHVIEEIDAVGRSQLSAVRYLLVQALLHDLKAEAWPQSPQASHWRAEARGLSMSPNCIVARWIASPTRSTDCRRCRCQQQFRGPSTSCWQADWRCSPPIFNDPTAQRPPSDPIRMSCIRGPTGVAANGHGW